MSLSKVIGVFLALVFLFFVLSYPEKLVELMQAFIDAAYGVAQALGNLNTRTGGGN